MSPALAAAWRRWGWLAFRIVAVGALAAICLSVFGPIMGDSRRYLRIAANLVAGHGFSSARVAPYLPEVFRAPLYPLFLALTTSCGLGIYGTVALQAALYVGSGVVVGRAARVIHGDPLAARLVALLLAIHAPIIRWVAQIDTEALMLPLFCAAAWLLARHLAAPRWGTALSLGALLGAMFLTRCDYVLPLAVVPLLVACRQRTRAALRKTAALVLVAGLLAGGWMVRNLLVMPGEMRPLGVGGGLALWVRSVEIGVEDLGERELIVQRNPGIRAIHDQSDPKVLGAADRALAREALGVLARNADTWLLGTAYNVLFRNWVEHFDPHVPSALGWVPVAWSGGLLLLAYIGIVSLWRRGHGVPQIVLVILAVASVHASLITEARYTAPLRPTLLIFSAWSLAQALRLLLRRLGRRGRWLGRFVEPEPSRDC